MTEQERIEKEAEQNADSFERRGCSAHYGYRVGYIAGANAELKRIDSDAAKIKHVITQLENKLLGKDSEIANHIAINSLLIDSDGEADLANKLYNVKEEMHKKDVAFKLITGQQFEEIHHLKEALRDVLHHWRDGFKPSGKNHSLKCYDKAFKLIELNKPEK